MIQQIKIPEGYDAGTLAAQLQSLMIDPAFEAFIKVIETNDMASIRKELEDIATPDAKMKELQYRLGVFKQIGEMPKIIASTIKNALESKESDEERDDPYFRQDDISEAR